MPNFEENEELVALERETEAKVVEMRRQIERGAEKAKAEFHAARDELRTASERGLKLIDSASEDAVDKIEAVQHRLGRLNFLVSTEKFESVAQLDRLRDSILAEMDEARAALAGLEDEARERLQNCEGDLECAWERLGQALAEVRDHMSQALADASTQFEEERGRLRERLDAEGAEPGKFDAFAAKAWDAWEAQKRWVIAFFQSPLEATPTSPPPEYSSTVATDDKGTGG